MRHQIYAAVGARCDVWRSNDVGHGQQWVVGRGRFGIKDIHRRACQMTFAQRLDQRRFVEHWPTAGIDQISTLAQGMQLYFTDQVVRFRCGWAVQGQNIGAFEQFLQ